MNHENSFQYTYSAKEQAEIQRIRAKYAPPAEDKIARLRRLDAAVTKKATSAALIVGIVGALILGLGMSLAMSELGDILGAYRDWSLIIGTGVGLIGIVPVCCAYPLYNRIVQKERARIAPEILRLTDDLLGS